MREPVQVREGEETLKYEYRDGLRFIKLSLNPPERRCRFGYDDHRQVDCHDLTKLYDGLKEVSDELGQIEAALSPGNVDAAKGVFSQRARLERLAEVLEAYGYVDPNVPDRPIRCMWRERTKGAQ